MLNPTSTADTGFYEFSSLSGADIKAVFHGQVIGEIQQLSYQLNREVAPIWTMGSQFARAYGHGKTMLAGTVVFTMIDQNALIKAMRKVAAQNPNMQPFLDREDAGPKAYVDNPTRPDVSADNTTANLMTPGVERIGAPVGDPSMSGVFVGEDNLNGTLTSDQIRSLPMYVTDILPFTITIVGANEYGRASVMSLYGVKVISETFAISIDHVNSDMTFQFLALGLNSWKPIAGGSAGGMV